MFQLKSKTEMIKEINIFGKKSEPQYICINPCYAKKNGHRYVLIETIKYKERKVVKFSNLKNFNPFSRGDVSDRFLVEKINKIGLKANPQFKCISSNSGKEKSKRHIVVQCLKNGIKKEVLYHSIMEGKNPFNETQNRIEVNKIQPMYSRLFTKHKIKYIKEFKMGKKSIDFVFILGNKKYGLEVKQSDKWHSEKNQIENYRRLSNLKPFGLNQVLLSDPKGKHKSKGSISIKELEKFIAGN